MYRGQQFKLDAQYTVASLKLWDGREWLWHDIPIARVRHRHLIGQVKSPCLIVHKGACHLSVPVAITPPPRPAPPQTAYWLSI